MADAKILSSRKQKITRMVLTAFLAAIEVILTLIYIPAGVINLNFGLVPIIIAGIFLGPLSGAIIGTVSGLVTMIQVLTGQGYFYVFLIAVNPVAASLLCVVKTAAAGFFSGLVWKAMKKLCKYSAVNALIASIVCPVVNTGIFAAGMFVVFGKALLADPEFGAGGNGSLVTIVFVMLIGINFFVELITSAVLGPILTGTLIRAKFMKQD